MSRVIIISVVRDFSMYEKCVRGNPNCVGAEFAVFDNRVENQGLSYLFNRFLSSRPENEDAWYMFCHEDFELREPICPLLDKLDSQSLWGPIGARTTRHFVYYKWELLGRVWQCDRNGHNLLQMGEAVPLGTEVETFDCQCLLVHSSLVSCFNLGFDENLTFDLYVEDFCMNAHERSNGRIRSRIIPMAACHWSGGNMGERYYRQEAYLKRKYPNSSATGTASLSLGGRITFFWKLTIWARKVKRFLCN